MRSLWMLLLTALAVAPLAAAPEDLGRELIPNPGFELDADGNGRPDGHAVDGRMVRWLEEDGNHFIRIGDAAVAAGQNGGIGQTLKLDPDWFKLKVSARVRHENVARGPEGWHNARMAMSFHAADGAQVGGWPNVLYWEGTSDGWATYERDYVIPEGARELRVSASLFTAGGQVDYDDWSVEVIALQPKLEDAALPQGVVAAWSADTAWRRETATRGRLSLNGLWRFVPLAEGLGEIGENAPPAGGQGWGWMKVPAAWPGRGVEATRPLGPDIWELHVDWTKVEQAWYQRELTVPAEWDGRRRFVSFDMPQTEAEVWIDGQRIGAARWPAGRVDITDHVQPGETATLAVRVSTSPLEPARMVAMREDLVEQVKADVKFRGLVGDVFLESEPVAGRITSLQTRPSVRQQALGLALGLADVAPGSYRVEAIASRDGQEAWRATSEPRPAAEALEVSLPWADPLLWDFEQPNLYDLRVRLLNAAGDVVDERATRFGFRELWLDGRELMLNGTPVHLRAIHFGGITRSDAQVSPAAVRNTIERLRSLGFNFFITGNYGLNPGETSSFTELLETADEMGFGFSMSLPHALSGVAGTGAGLTDLWKRTADYVVELTGDHPSALMYGGNHNRLGYHGDQNPAKIDGIHVQWSDGTPPDGYRWQRQIAADAEAHVRALDPTRELYHHQSGHMGNWHTINIYLCWAEAQERSEWLSHWATAGVKPLFFVEWGPPHQASWGGHRQGPFIWRNNVNSEPLGIEFGAMLTGDAAYAPDETMERYVDRYEQVYARREPFHISSVLGSLWDPRNEKNNTELKTLHTDIEWPRLRTWGITAILPWDQGFVATRDGRGPREVPQATDWANLQRPGRSPDYLVTDGDYFHSVWPDWQLTSWGRSLQRWNQPTLVYLAGDPADFTERGHNVTAGETLTKQVIFLNHLREASEASYAWELKAGDRVLSQGRGTLAAPAGRDARAELPVAIPAEATGELVLSLRAQTPGGEQTDRFVFHGVQPAVSPVVERVALYDPEGESSRDLARLGVRGTPIEADADLSAFDTLIVGRRALAEGRPAPDLAPLLARGGRVLVLEQDEDTLTHRLGFRANDPSLRQVFTRVPQHAALAGLDTARLADWRGDATLIPPTLDLPYTELTDPKRDWLGFDNTRVWKWGNTGQVASVVIEKPQRGDFTALVDGGFDLQYAPLLLQRVGGGQVLWCQMDVTARTAADPAADRLLTNLAGWAVDPPGAAQTRPVRYVGGDDGAALLEAFGVSARRVTPADAAASPGAVPGGVLIVGPGAGASLAPVKDALAQAVAEGLVVVALAQTPESLRGWLPFEPTLGQEARTVSPVPEGRLFTGLGPSDLHWRGRREVTLVGGPGTEPNVLAEVPHGAGAYVFCQVLPGDWDYADPYRVYLKRTHNRTASMLARLLANAGAPGEAPTLAFWREPAQRPVDLTGQWQAVRDPDGTLTVDALTDGMDWQPVKVPGTFEESVPAWSDYDGAVWYRTRFDWNGPLDVPVALNLGRIDDEDWTFVNGRAVGHIGKDTNPDNHWEAPRAYTLAPGTLKRGANEVVVKVLDTYRSGGLVGGEINVRVPARWLESVYLDVPAKLDDPYRYNRW